MCAPLVTRRMSKRCFLHDYSLLGHHAILSDLLQMFRRSYMPLSSISLLRSPCRWTQQLLVSQQWTSHHIASDCDQQQQQQQQQQPQKNILLHSFRGSLVYMWRHAHNGVINSIKTWQKTFCILQIPSISLGIWFTLQVVTILLTHNN